MRSFTDLIHGGRSHHISGFIKRNYYLEALRETLSNKDIVFITGLKRVGKTALKKLFIEELLEKFPPNRLLYASLDSIGLEKYSYQNGLSLIFY